MKEESRQTKLTFDFLRDSLSKLPSDADKELILKNLDNLIKYLQDLQEKIRSLPNDSRQSEVLSSIGVVKGFLQSAKDNPPLSAALGLSYDRSGSRKLKKQISPQLAEKLLSELRILTTDEVQQKLLDYKNVSMSELRALANYFGISNSEKMSRADLIDRIVKLGFANIRGYELLRSPDKKQ